MLGTSGHCANLAHPRGSLATILAPPTPTIALVVVSPQPNPETVAALLDTAWRVADAEIARTDALDRRAATLATFASLLTTLTATLGAQFVERIGTWATAVYCAGLGALALSVALAVKALLPSEFVTLGTEYVRLLPTWSQVLRAPDQVRGELLRALVVSVAREREANASRAGAVRLALLLLVVGLALIVVEAATLAFGHGP
jgi:hypothetical protein